MRWGRPSSRNRARLRLLRLASRALASTATRPSPRPRRVLLLRPDHIGDVLLTAPAVGLLRDRLPDTHLTYLVGPWSAEAARHGPPVDRLWTLPFPGFVRGARRHPGRPTTWPGLLAPYVLLAAWAVRLRREQFDMAVVLREDHWWGALLALAAGIPIRIGGQTPETSPLLTHLRRGSPGEHATQQSLALARLALRTTGVPVAPDAGALDVPMESDPEAPGAPRGALPHPVFRVSQPATAAADLIWQRHTLTGHRVVALHPNAGAPLKSWPVDNWARLADGLHASALDVVLVGAPADGPLLHAIATRMARPPAVVACGQSLDVSAAIYQHSTFLIALDSGAAHLAAAVGTPTLRLYGPAPVSRFGPWPQRPDQRVLVTDQLACVPCGHLEAPPCGAACLPACMLAIGADDVLKAVRLQLGQD